jgi:hypothetical protein
MDDRAALTGKLGRSTECHRDVHQMAIAGAAAQLGCVGSGGECQFKCVREKPSAQATPAVCREDGHRQFDSAGRAGRMRLGEPEYAVARTLRCTNEYADGKIQPTRICRDRGVTEARVEARVPVHEIKSKQMSLDLGQVGRAQPSKPRAARRARSFEGEHW